MDNPAPIHADLAEPAISQPVDPACAGPIRPARALASGSLLLRLEVMARQELAQLAASHAPSLDDPMLAGLCWDLGLDGARALHAGAAGD